MKKAKKEYKRKCLTVGALSFVVIGLVVGILVLSQISEPLIKQSVVYQRKYRHIDLGDPVGDASGFCCYYHYPHQGTPASAYATNLSTGNAYEYINSLSGEMTGETPHSTAIDYVCKFVVNDTVAYNTTTSRWEPTWLLMNVTVDYNFGSDIGWTTMTLVEIANTTSFAWYNGYINNGGSGYTLSQNQKTNSSLNLTGWF